MLFYGNRTEVDIIFKKEFDELKKMYKNLKVTHFLSRTPSVSGDDVSGRMNAEEILTRIEGVKSPEFLICGSISFVSDLWKGLRKWGIPEEAIYTEAFFSH